MQDFVVDRFQQIGGVVIGHYTAMLWATSDRIGCGVSTYNSGGRFAYNFYIVCQYRNPGNYLN